MLSVQVTIRYFLDEDSNYEAYEELTLTVKTDNPTEAIEKAKHYAMGYCVGYQNCFHETVRGEICEISDVFEAFEEIDGVQEVFAKRKTNLSYHEDFELDRKEKEKS